MGTPLSFSLTGGDAANPHGGRALPSDTAKLRQTAELNKSHARFFAHSANNVNFAPDNVNRRSLTTRSEKAMPSADDGCARHGLGERKSCLGDSFSCRPNRRVRSATCPPRRRGRFSGRFWTNCQNLMCHAGVISERGSRWWLSCPFSRLTNVKGVIAHCPAKRLMPCAANSAECCNFADGSPGRNTAVEINRALPAPANGWVAIATETLGNNAI